MVVAAVGNANIMATVAMADKMIVDVHNKAVVAPISNAQHTKAKVVADAIPINTKVKVKAANIKVHRVAIIAQHKARNSNQPTTLGIANSVKALTAASTVVHNVNAKADLTPVVIQHHAVTRVALTRSAVGKNLTTLNKARNLVRTKKSLSVTRKNAVL
jgi:hypothetical protein